MPLPTSAQFSFVLRVRIEYRPGMLGRDGAEGVDTGYAPGHTQEFGALRVRSPE